MGFSVLLSAAAPLCETNEGGIIGSITDWLVSIMMRSAASAYRGHRIGIDLPPDPQRGHPALAGFTAARGSFGVIEAIIWATVGSLLGAWVLYGIARWIGLERIQRIVDRIPGVDRDDVAKADRWFTRYGHWSVLIGRVIPVVRSLISIPAGFNKMSFLTFSGWTLLGSAVWNTVLICAGYLLGDQWCSILGVLDAFENIVIVIVVVAVILLLIRWVRNLRRANGTEANSPNDAGCAVATGSGGPERPLMARNHALAEALSRAGKELAKAKAQISQITRPPLTFATMVRVDGSHIDEEGVRHASAEVIAGTRRMIVPIARVAEPRRTRTGPDRAAQREHGARRPA